MFDLIFEVIFEVMNRFAINLLLYSKDNSVIKFYNLLSFQLLYNMRKGFDLSLFNKTLLIRKMNLNSSLNLLSISLSLGSKKSYGKVFLITGSKHLKLRHRRSGVTPILFN